jgi:hypothetical protein
MTAAARKAFSSVAHFLSFDGWNSTLPSSGDSEKEAEHRIGEYSAEYDMPTEAEIAALNAEAEAFLKKCKPVSR